MREMPVTPTATHWQVTDPPNKLDIRIDYDNAVDFGSGYLDYIEVNARRKLSFDLPQFNFRDARWACGEDGTADELSESI